MVSPLPPPPSSSQKLSLFTFEMKKRVFETKRTIKMYAFFAVGSFAWIHCLFSLFALKIVNHMECFVKIAIAIAHIGGRLQKILFIFNIEM